ncbi:MAG: putative toxin-antitoxin system toxin component, PIN family [Chloroflexia bacterium]|nr:putative toxin-antitoxin system toxin component, PIN family [Chloroflexia bacterium]
MILAAVLDANVIVSGVLGYDRPQSPPGELLRRWRTGTYLLVTSDHIVGEVRRVFQRRWFVERGIADEGAWVFSLLEERSTSVEITVSVTGVTRDPDDDLVIATALSAGVGLVVSGDDDLLSLGEYESVRFFDPAQFVALLDERGLG